MSKEIKTSIQIDAPLSKVWETLLGFESYPRWSKFIRYIKGKPVSGEKLQVGIDGMRFKPTVLVSDEEREFRWKGQLWIPGLFDGEHYFTLSEGRDGSTVLCHGEHFSGLLVPLFGKKLKRDIPRGFQSFNQALKKRVEQSSIA